MDLAPGGHHRAALLGLIRQLRSLVLRQKAHHPHDLLQHRDDLYPLRLVYKAAVQPGQPQQVLGDAAEALGLAADVRYKIPDGSHVHIVRLQNGIRQKPDGRQRRFQLVAGIGHKAAAQIFRGLKPVGEAVELLPDLRDLIVAGDMGAVLVGALPHLTDGGEQRADLPRQHPGKQHAQQHHRQRNADRKPHQIRLQPLQQRRLLCVIFIGVHRADDAVLIQHRRGRPAAERSVPVGAGKGVIALQRLHDLRIERIFPHGAAGFPGIVEHQPRAVRH